MKIESYFKKSPVFQLIDFGRRMEDLVNEELSSLELSYFQALILVSIHVEGRTEIQFRELAQIFPISKGAISQNISLLEERGFLKRITHSDRRSSNLRITEKGVKVAFKALSVLERYEQRLDEHLSGEFLKNLESIFAKPTVIVGK